LSLDEDKYGRKTSVRIEPALLAKVQHACIDRGVSQTEAIEEGLRMWLATAKKPAKLAKRAAPALQIAAAADQIRAQLDRLSELASTLK
jgi:Arc/MetJ-type ribon-helix-helix transcriptional regulator